MNNEFKLVPVDPTPEMYAAASCDTREQGILGAGYKAMLAAAPQPPALGGEVEVVYQYLSKGEFARWHSLDESQLIEATQQGFVTRQLIDRAHVAPLQAEIERQKFQSHCHLQRAVIAEKERDQLKARCDELEGLVRKWRKEAGSTFAYMARESDAALSKPAGNNQPS